jgi:hypothetical protein
MIEDAHRVLDELGTLARRIAEGRECQQRQPRLIAKPACDSGRLDGDFGKLRSTRHLGHGGIGDQHGVAAGQHQR